MLTLLQQHRVMYHTPKKISPAPSRNHHTCPGRMSARMITSPASIAAHPTFPLLPRKKTASRPIHQYTRKAASDLQKILFCLPGSVLSAQLVQLRIALVAAAAYLPFFNRLGHGTARFLQMGTVVEAA